jgi:hypothetical protein
VLRALIRPVVSFALLGPLMGAAAMLVWFVCVAIFSRPAYTGPFMSQDVILIVVASSYALGVVPAALTGLAWGYLIARRFAHGSPSNLFRLVTGAALGGVFSLSVALLWFEVPLKMRIAMAVCGLVSGGILSLAVPVRAT